MARAGWLTIIFGLFATGAGVVGGILQMFKDIRRAGQVAGANPTEDLPTNFIQAMNELLKGLKDAPVWLAIAIIGIILVIVGASLLHRSRPPTAVKAPYNPRRDKGLVL